MNDDVWLQVSGPHLTTRAGRRVVLRGVGLGGWMNMENFITGYPATESLQREALRKALGRRGYDAFFDRFLDVLLRRRGRRLPRVARAELACACPSTTATSKTTTGRSSSRRRASALLDRAIERCARHGIYSDHRPARRCPAARTSTGTATTRPTGRSSGRTGTSRTGWCTCGRRSPTATGTTPGWPATTPSTSRATPSGDDDRPVLPAPARRRSARSIRDHILFLDGNRYSTEFDVVRRAWPNTVYTVPRLRAARLRRRRRLPGRHPRRVRRPRRPRRRRSSRAPSTCAHRHADLGRRVRPGLHRRPSATTHALPDARRPTRDLPASTAPSWACGRTRTSASRGCVTPSPTPPTCERIAPVLEQEGPPRRRRLGLVRRRVCAHILDPIEATFRRGVPRLRPSRSASGMDPRAGPPHPAGRAAGRASSAAASKGWARTERRRWPTRSASARA